MSALHASRCDQCGTTTPTKGMADRGDGWLRVFADGGLFDFCGVPCLRNHMATVGPLFNRRALQAEGTQP